MRLLRRTQRRNSQSQVSCCPSKPQTLPFEGSHLHYYSDSSREVVGSVRRVALLVELKKSKALAKDAPQNTLCRSRVPMISTALAQVGISDAMKARVECGQRDPGPGVQCLTSSHTRRRPSLTTSRAGECRFCMLAKPNYLRITG